MQLLLVSKCFLFIKLVLSENRLFCHKEDPYYEEGRALVNNWCVFSADVYNYIFNVLLQNRVHGWQEMNADQLLSAFHSLRDSKKSSELGFDETFDWTLVEKILSFSAKFAVFRDHSSLRVLHGICVGLARGQESLSENIDRIVNVTTEYHVSGYAQTNPTKIVVDGWC